VLSSSSDKVGLE